MTESPSLQQPRDEQELPPMPNEYEAAAHIFPCDLLELGTGEKTCEVCSIPVGSPTHGRSVPLWTSGQMQEYARAAIRASLEAPLREPQQGWKLVPMEPTWDMLMAAVRERRDHINTPSMAVEESAGRVYSVMLAASPEAAVPMQAKDPAPQSDEGLAMQVDDYEAVLADLRRLVRELDVLLNGESGAAKQASLCDIVAQVSREGIRAMQVDAQRYRWLRKDGYEHCDDELPYVTIHTTNDWGNWINKIVEGPDLDAAIDAARSSKKGTP